MKQQDREKIKLSLLTVFSNATQVYRRTIPKEKKQAYTYNLKIAINDLVRRVDDDSIKNENIRDGIIRLSKDVGISIGASQKIINVYLKFYCILANKSNSIIKELDCPIDSFVIKENKLEKISLGKLDLEDYTRMQEILGQKYGVRLLADVRAWDEKKIY